MWNSFLPVDLEHPPAEEVDVGPGHGLPGAGIGDEVVDLLLAGAS